MIGISTRAKRLAINALLATFSVWLALISHYMSVPFFPMLKLDISDFPIFTSAILFGTSDGIAILFVVSLVRTIFFSVAGWSGFFMRIVMIIAVTFLGIYNKKNKNFILYSAVAVILSTIVKIPVSYIFWTKFHFMPEEFIKSIMIPTIIPYNLIKNTINIFMSWIFTGKIKKIAKI